MGKGSAAVLAAPEAEAVAIYRCYLRDAMLNDESMLVAVPSASYAPVSQPIRTPSKIYRGKRAWLVIQIIPYPSSHPHLETRKPQLAKQAVIRPNEKPTPLGLVLSRLFMTPKPRKRANFAYTCPKNPLEAHPVSLPLRI
ncbi:predicted protein [Plenodomus lingam JN3]|uniref:Predicted protein n=1 Tax=Leptosphaeria maculans (strain JN3 / isolate v23.1.3 / race Av1-4-5-6-7-8) TaxID=985895 RepID=E5A4R0_LEPMJ|nr:predicted protein [Plenodomus lingam JN3]CBX98608.1 predicted protein [Plenodomus lingam JN3]